MPLVHGLKKHKSASGQECRLLADKQPLVVLDPQKSKSIDVAIFKDGTFFDEILFSAKKVHTKLVVTSRK